MFPEQKTNREIKIALQMNRQSEKNEYIKHLMESTSPEKVAE